MSDNGKAGQFPAGSPAVVILAGGLGTRISHLLPNLPKPMAPVSGRPFLEWCCRYLAGQGIGRIMLSTGFRGEVIEHHFARVKIPGVLITCHQEMAQLGTAGGFLNAAGAAGTTHRGWIICNGDSLVLASIGPFLSAVTGGGESCGVLGVTVEDTARFGTLKTGPGNRLQRFAEKRPGSGTINAGVYYFPDSAPARFPNRQPLSFEVDVFPALLEAGVPVLVHQVTAPFLDIGTPESLAQAGEFVEKNQHFFRA